MERDCLNGCSELIRTSKTRRLFCSQTCQQKFLKTFEGRCYYCDEPEDIQDHIYPQSIGHGVGEKLPAYEDCNVFLSDKYPNSHMRRIGALIGYLEGDNKKEPVSENDPVPTAPRKVWAVIACLRRPTRRSRGPTPSRSKASGFAIPCAVAPLSGKPCRMR